MRVILTHDIADFDAIASQLGAWLLDRASLPVLPDRINRNVRAFLTLYGVELPFVERRDLPPGEIESAVVVDTQTVQTLKGMAQDIPVWIVDHHPLRKDLPESWRTLVEPVGATTTLLVEFLLEERAAPGRIEATLLLLGIYEDTGRLTYTRTTPRDLRAAAALLELGASLQIVGDFLNHPLSLAQQALLDEARSSAETLEIAGNTIVIGTADAAGAQEELSPIAHKLRDETEPDALFLLFRVAGGVQLIARSTTDRIDAGALAGKFGGGGHQRAAAALVKGADPAAVHSDLLERLPELVQPVLTVDEIMSRGEPQVLEPETPVGEALSRMQRFGHEGYPVVLEGAVIGLLTRRAVDRAVNHKLNLSVREVMDAGAVTIPVDATVEALQRLMTETGWGQIPVVEPDSGSIIGIVTRTDLLNMLSPQPALAGRIRLADRLDAALVPPYRGLIHRVAEAAHEQQVAAYLVGGFVRDLLLDRPSLDFDLVVEGDAIALARLLARKYGGRVTTHRQFGTAKWHLAHGLDDGEAGPETLDLVTARTEFYTHPSALPTVARGSIKLDLHRRDFTFNTLAVRLDGPHYGDLHDYWGGLHDLDRRLIRVLHSLSFVDDPTRMLRAVRFEQRFDFEIEPRTLELLEAAAGLLARVSGDRIRHELDHIFAQPRAARMFARLGELGLLEAVEPGLEKVPGGLMFAARLPEDHWDLPAEIRGDPLEAVLPYIHWWLDQPPAEARRFSRRLKLKQRVERTLLDACRLWADLPDLEGAAPSRITHRLDEVDRLAVFTVRSRLGDAPLAAAIDTYARTWRHVKPETDGSRLAERGLPAGPVYKSILTRLRSAYLDGKIRTPQEESALLDELIELHSEPADG
ncbi:MAG TPA: CBS domain-containing protein [Anaerolineales bacterium]|nr:CBS domain-containing protein [Anaerolineales bacterium]